jgi:hypothetical protein
MARGVGRRIVFVIATAFVVVIVLLAVSWSEARTAFLCIAAAVLAASWWLLGRLPRGRASGWELRVEAGVCLVVGALLAVAVPTTRIFCECPAPRGVRGAFECGCAAVDRHVGLRVGIALTGLVLSIALALLARRRDALRGVRLHGEGG